MAIFRREQQKKWALQFEITFCTSVRNNCGAVSPVFVSSCEGARKILHYFFSNAQIDKMEIAHAKA